MNGNKSARVQLLDELRGFLIIFVVLYHLGYDLYLFGVDMGWLFSPAMNILRDFFVGLLVIISGISSHFSHSNVLRGAKTLGLAMLLTLVTYLVMPTQLILFGILHFFGVSMLLYAALHKPLSRVPALPGFLLSVLLFFVTFDVYYGVLGISGMGLTLPLPRFLYDVPLLYPLGFACAGLASADYYPLIPWFFLFLAGSFCGESIKAGRFPAFFYGSHCRPLATIGRHTLLLYLVHQPIVYGVLYLIFTLMRP